MIYCLKKNPGNKRESYQLNVFTDSLNVTSAEIPLSRMKQSTALIFTRVQPQSKANFVI